jgi:hypothetical protein
MVGQTNAASKQIICPYCSTAGFRALLPILIQRKDEARFRILSDMVSCDTEAYDHMKVE